MHRASFVLAGVITALVLLLPGLSATPVWNGHPETSASVASSVFGSNGVVPGSRLVVEMVPNHPVGLAIALQYSHLPELRAFLRAQRDPSSPEYGVGLTAAQFGKEFAPSPSERADVRAFFLSHGATSVTNAGGGDILWVDLPESAVERVFHTSLAWYSSPGSYLYYGETGAPTLPTPLLGMVAGISGLSDASSPGLHLPAALASGKYAISTGRASSLGQFDTVQGTTDQLFWGTDFRAVYNELPLLNQGLSGSGYAVATLLTSGYNQTMNRNLPPYDPAAVSLYYNLTFPQGSTPPQPFGVPVTVNGTIPPNPGPPPNVTGVGTLGDDIGSVDENSLDLEMAGSLAPGAALYNFYFAGSLISQTLGGGYAAFDVALADALNYNYGPDRLAAVSNSWGLPDMNDAGWDHLEVQAQAMEVTLLASSGDQGNAPSNLQGHPQGQWPGFPATAAFDDYGVVAVGGTEVRVSGTPTGTPWNPQGNVIPTPGYDAGNITGVSSTTAWFSPSSTVANYGGTEGGISPYVNEPIWQARSAAQSAIKYTASIEGTNASRAVPDIALCAFDTIAFSAAQAQSGGYLVSMGVFEGTSISSPLMAGLVAVLSQDIGHPLGFLDPAIYNMSSYFLENGGTGPFTPVTSGSNYLFNASAGWDALTGWGSVNAARLATDLGNPTYTSYVYNPSAMPGVATGVPPTGGQPPPAPSQKSPLPFSVFYLILAIVVIIVVIALIAGTRKPRQVPIAPPPPASPGYYYPPAPTGGPPPPLPPAGYPPTMLVCGACHRTFPPQWGFCPYCGTVPRR